MRSFKEHASAEESKVQRRMSQAVVKNSGQWSVVSGQSEQETGLDCLLAFDLGLSDHRPLLTAYRSPA